MQGSSPSKAECPWPVNRKGSSEHVNDVMSTQPKEPKGSRKPRSVPIRHVQHQFNQNSTLSKSASKRQMHNQMEDDSHIPLNGRRIMKVESRLIFLYPREQRNLRRIVAHARAALWLSRTGVYHRSTPLVDKRTFKDKLLSGGRQSFGKQRGRLSLAMTSDSDTLQFSFTSELGMNSYTPSTPITHEAPMLIRHAPWHLNSGKGIFMEEFGRCEAGGEDKTLQGQQGTGLNFNFQIHHEFTAIAAADERARRLRR
ncbi:hypothetical protein DFH06DRAFT_1427007 [Mycena polygramma]|nr:hypothetical protein DFH06DRAFT_1427007 [Mycena polygramma]